MRNIRIAYQAPNRSGEVLILDGLSFDVGFSEFVAVAGRSGSGKTSLLRIAAGLLAPSRGEVLWEGEGVADWSRRVVADRRRALMGIVFQSGGLLEHLTAAENVALGDMPTGVRTGGRQRAESLLELLGVEGRGRHFPAQLSGGERQRVALARALFSDPPMLIVDEPTANLDRATADSIIALLIQLRDKGRTLLVASHDAHLVQEADRTVRLV